MPAGRRPQRRDLDVWMNGQLVGCWSFSPAQGHAFAYAASWLQSPSVRPLSLSLPISSGVLAHKGEFVRAYFDNLLPDSPRIRRRLQARFKTAGIEAFDLLAEIGRDCAGAVQLLPAGSDPPDVKRIDAVPLAAGDVAHLLDVATRGGALAADDEEDGDLRISLAGAQEKSALLRHGNQWCRPLGATPTTHLVKLPLGLVGARKADLSTSVENEWLCARILKAYGLPVAECHIERFEQYKALVVERFDRRLIDGRWWARLPQEDFCQATGTPPEMKYQAHGGPGIDRILDLLRGAERAAADRSTFLAAQLLFWMLAAPDGHAKNFSIFLLERGRFAMTPLYDVMSAWPMVGPGPAAYSWHKLKMAMSVRGENEHYRFKDILRRHWNATAKRCALGADFDATIDHVLRLTPGVVDAVSKDLPADFPAQVSGPIFEGMLGSAQRLAAMPAR